MARPKNHSDARPRALPLRVLGLLSIGALLGACGARTGLPVPDAEPANMRDGGMPDAGRDTCIELPPDGSPVALELEVEAVVGRADVTFLIDTTASMGEEIERIRQSLRDRIGPAIADAIPDSRIAVATFADFPISPYGTPGEDLPFVLRLPASNDITSVQAAVNGIDLDDGMDAPESQVEALYQLMTGEGIGPWVAPAVGCPGGGFGFACLRSDAIPVVLLFTDASFHNAYDGSNAYRGFPGGIVPHRYSDARDVLQERGARVIGFDSGRGAPRESLEALARDTNTTDGSQPLVYSIGVRGEGLSTSVVEAIETFAGTVRQDISAELVSVPMGLDVAIEPISALPASGIDGIVDGVFVGAQAHTRLFWNLVVSSSIPRGPRPQVLTIRVQFRADGRRRLGRQDIEVVIPAIDGTGCGAL